MVYQVIKPIVHLACEQLWQREALLRIVRPPEADL